MNRPAGLVKIYKNINLETADYQISPAGDVCVYTRCSPEKSDLNEDAAAIIQMDNNDLLLAVADGVGGQPAASQASAYLVDCLKEAYDFSVKSGTDLRDCILSGIEDANRKILESANGSATTLAAVVIQDNCMRSYHIGDSAVILTGQKGKIIAETILHSPTGYAVESGIMHEDDAIHHEDRHIVSNVVGAKDMHISMSIPVHIKRFDTLLLATDGLFDNVEKQTIVDTIRKGPIKKNINKLCGMASGRMTDPGNLYKPDDLTCILFRRNS
jgi:serine/threonine protein phosphatase PrpC